MTKRQEKILSAVIKKYIQTAEPVGSKIIAEKHSFKLSTATIRNEMKELENLGYITHPHTSAGRIPTDKGYRFFVDTLMKERSLSVDEQRQLQTELLKTKAKYNRLARTTARALSHLSNNLVISGILDSDEIWEAGMPKLLKNPEFQDSEEIYNIAEALDLLDEHLEDICSKDKDKSVKVYIGKENPLNVENCSMVVSQIKYPSGQKGFIAIIGPKRMKYGKNVSLLKHITKLLGSGLMVILFINFLPI